MRSIVCIICFACVCLLSATAYDVQLELVMPGTLFGPDSPVFLNLNVMNTGQELLDAKLFVALTVGTGDFWFYPDWQHYPPDIDWEHVSIPAEYADTWSIIPEFSWPSGAGEFPDAMFLAAVMHNDLPVSNLAEYTFGWTEIPQPTPTPTITPTPYVTPTPTQTPEGYVYIAPGQYMRGSLDDEACRWQDETPHQVILTRGFYIMTTEVTRQMWAELQNAEPSLPDDSSNPDVSPTMYHPVQRVSWIETILFANLLSKHRGYTPCYYIDENFTIVVDADNYQDASIFCDFDASGYRLPTEAEWEYAAGAGAATPFSFNEPFYDESTCTDCDSGTLPVMEQHAVFCANSDGGTMPVASKQPNPDGLYDMHGNVWEWCWDWYGDYPAETVTDPEGASEGTFRVKRGGGWNSDPVACRISNRSSAPSGRDHFLGFRLVRTKHQ